jgi:hypothetical protein
MSGSCSLIFVAPECAICEGLECRSQSAMKISGHKTASVFRRYDVVEQAGLADEAARLDAKQKFQAAPELIIGQSWAELTKTTQKMMQEPITG